MIARLLSVCSLFACMAWTAPLPELPGSEVTDAERAMQRSASLVQEPEAPKRPDSLGWTAPGIEEQLSQDESLIGMGMGAILVP